MRKIFKRLQGFLHSLPFLFGESHQSFLFFLIGLLQEFLEVTEHPEPSLTDAQYAHERDTLLEQLSQQKREEALNLFMTNLDNRLKKEGKLKINQTEMNNLTRSRS